MYTDDEIAEMTGDDGLPCYLSILGVVYDVTSGCHKYKTGYRWFLGKDGSRAFLSGRFEEEEGHAAHDLSDFSNSQLASLQQWTGMYEKDYIRKGVLYHRDGTGFYDSLGNPTAVLKEIRRKIKVALQGFRAVWWFRAEKQIVICLETNAVVSFFWS